MYVCGASTSARARARVCACVRRVYLSVHAYVNLPGLTDTWDRFRWARTTWHEIQNKQSKEKRGVSRVLLIYF